MAEPTKGLILAVRLRGTAGDNPDVEKTMETLNLERTFQARLLENTPSNVGMLRSAKNLVAWGEVSPELLGQLIEKRGERYGNIEVDEGFVKHFRRTDIGDLAKAIVAGEVKLRQLSLAGLRPKFRLHPPKGGFKRSLRHAATDGGELGYRGEAINLLVKRMI